MSACPFCHSKNLEKMHLTEPTPKPMFYCNRCHRISPQEDLK